MTLSQIHSFPRTKVVNVLAFLALKDRSSISKQDRPLSYLAKEEIGLMSGGRLTVREVFSWGLPLTVVLRFLLLETAVVHM